MSTENNLYHSDTCRICKAAFDKKHYFTENMFGLKNSFLYQECSSCHCLQIDEIPADIDTYYPSYYYSFNQPLPTLKKTSFFKKIAGNLRLKKVYRRHPELLKYLKQINTKFSDRILDVGCGKGKLISELFNQGFTNIMGVDKFVPEEIKYDFGLNILKCDLSELKPASYDLIMMHHVLEHIDQQQQFLLDSRKLLKEEGCLLIRIPIQGKAWEVYQENWVQLDAPRHAFIHTVKSMELLAKQTGFEIRHTIFDATTLQFFGSELYKRNIPLFSAEHNYEVFPVETLFSESELAAFEKKTQEWNASGDGDSAAFYLYKTNIG